MRPATPQGIDADNPWAIDFNSLISLITATVCPYDWEDVGGPGSIAPDVPRLALLVSASEETHDQLSRLMTMLRRSRYAAQRGDKPWEAAVNEIGGAMAGGSALSALSVDLRADELPEPEAEELTILQVRRELSKGL